MPPQRTKSRKTDPNTLELPFASPPRPAPPRPAPLAVALAAFLATTRVEWRAGLLMGLGQWLGARLGARTAMRGGAHLIRPIFLTMVVLAAAKMFYDGWWR